MDTNNRNTDYLANLVIETNLILITSSVSIPRLGFR